MYLLDPWANSMRLGWLPDVISWLHDNVEINVERVMEGSE